MLNKVTSLVYRAAHGADATTTASSFYDLVDRLPNGESAPMEAYRGSVLLIANVAAK